MDLSVVIQAGGESHRMGRNKALAPFLGRPLIARVVERLSSIAAEIIVTTNQAEEFAFLGLPCYPDLLPGLGALGGLYTALSVARLPCAAVVACDLPFANPDLLAFAHRQVLAGGYDGMVPRHAQGLEPLHAVYRREPCLPWIRRALVEGRLRVDAWFDRAQIKILDVEEYAALDPSGLAFFNANTPQELARAEELAREQDQA